MGFKFFVTGSSVLLLLKKPSAELDVELRIRMLDLRHR